MSVRAKSCEYIQQDITGVIQAHHIQENTTAMTEFTRPHKIKLTQILCPSMDSRRTHDFPFLTDKFLVIGSCWEFRETKEPNHKHLTYPASQLKRG